LARTSRREEEVTDLILDIIARLAATDAELDQ
jgi:hypothetical protein